VQVSLTSRERLPRVALWIVIVAVGSAAMTGCGSAGASNTASVPHRAFQFSQCMRTRGVPQFPDPGPNAFQFTPGSIISQSPAFQGALNACQKYLPRAGHPPPIPETVRLEMIAFAKCMRANGVPNFPDPGPHGIKFPVTSPIPQSPAFRRAQNSPCKKYLSR
jgi:hypothetical protein